MLASASLFKSLLFFSSGFLSPELFIGDVQVSRQLLSNPSVSPASADGFSYPVRRFAEHHSQSRNRLFAQVEHRPYLRRRDSFFFCV